ncbi:hypothetical protein NQ315_010150 [Exocentrus adspersus]|uniref:THAP-type domain-containing protein n=1 Tax=Exocentrus adspersus TaxID=1586481 RepID=A0AAV8WBG2_9CUCU|nr:hypothetical protein NQ315_010150 [Exocentrus adspersus]
MGGCRCSYKNCPNTTKTTENVHFFHYPVKHKERCKIWIENANKPQFCDLEEDQLRNKVICEVHFEDRWFPNSQKKRLLQGAIPTLDAGADIDPNAPETPVFLSTHLQDVQVLPANDDGTIFILDTDSMFGRAPKVESYIYKNGDIVPSSKIKQSVVPAKPSTSATSNTMYPFFKHEKYEPSEMPEFNKVMIKDEVPEYSENILNKSILNHHISSQSMESVETVDYEPSKLSMMYEESDSDSAQKRILPRPGTTKSILKGSVDKTVSRNCLRKIKQHSRDIASIKRMLKQKALAESKPDINIFLNSMKEQLPPTFFTVLNLNLNNKYDLTDDDIDFFTTIHKTSPELYQLLIDRYNWNLPCVDIVEDGSME